MRNVPRIRDVEAMLALLERPRRDASSGATTTRSSLCAADVDRAGRGRPRAAPSASARRSCSPARCWRASARADMPPPGGDVIGRRRLDPHLDAFRALGAQVERRARHRARAPDGPARRRRLHGRAVGDGDRERADGRRAHAGHDRRSATPPASRTSRTSRACSCKMGADIDGIGSNVLTVHGRERARRLRRTTIGPDHIEIGSFMALAGVHRRRAAHQGHRARTTCG